MSRNIDANSAQGEGSQNASELEPGNESVSADDAPQSLSDEIDMPVGEEGGANGATTSIATFEERKSQGEAANDSDVPTDDGRFINFGLVFLLITLGGFSLWSFFAPLASAVIASGEVVVDSHRKSIQHYEGGIVENIFVKNGDLVDAGDPLIQLDVTQFAAQQVSSLKRLLTTKAELERLIAEQNFNTTLTFSDELLEHAMQDVDIKNALDQQQQLHKARLKAFMQERDALKNRIEQIQQQITGLMQQSEILSEKIVSLQDEQKAFTTLFEEGLGDGQRARELDRSVLATKNDVARLESDISRLKIQITETELQIATREQDYLKEVGERIRNAQNDYYSFQEGLQISADRAKRSVIRSPEVGIVVDMQVLTIGSVVQPGQTLLDLVPEQDTFVVEAKILTQDINEVYIGQKVDIRFSAFNSMMTKIIEGEVINVSADRLLSERDNSPYYQVRIRVSEQGERDMSDNMMLKPGMPAEVMIRRADRTMFSYLIKPIADSFARSFKEK